MTETKELITPESLIKIGFTKAIKHSKVYYFKNLRIRLHENDTNAQLWIGKEFIGTVKYVDELEKYQ